MKAVAVVVGVVALVVALVIGAWVSAYGKLNSGNQAVKKEWADVDATLQRRADLIPNLVKTVQAYAKHEDKVFTEVAEARSKMGQVNVTAAATDPAQMKQVIEAQGQMSSALSRLLAVAEQYPELKANQNFLDLQSQLEGTENRINVARQRYNEAVQPYNTLVNGLFAHIVAAFHGFKPAEYFEAAPESRKAPEVNFN